MLRQIPRYQVPHLKFCIILAAYTIIPILASGKLAHAQDDRNNKT